ncbi:MAG: glycosyltransferase family 39 protein [Planctomycetes bacterium]|nr:glycosyltransferase family 39 protein [Planctomycetota bacterium]MCB9910145.1 glycosyltransferase family 39 protein [Planctomycetota bacterium]MCB9913088.1 glycosyltransferase family 39 protein [Planctomycetota bacterium]HPF15121.1 glycosyltransferase family 39 protein [Planctomycetota bacterium]
MSAPRNEPQAPASPAQTPSPPSWLRHGWVLAMVLAAVVRLAYGLEHRHALDFATPTVDAKYHDAWARTMAGLPAGLAPGEGDASVFEGPSLRPIGYPWFLAGIYRLGGGDLALAVWLQHLLGVVSVGILWWTVRPAAGALAATWAAGALALHFAPVYFEGELQATGLLIALDLAALYAYLRLLDKDRWAWALAAGVGFGLAALVRPNVGLPAVLLIVALLGLHRSVALRHRVQRAGIMALGLLLGLLPGTLHNWRATGEFLPLTATAGINLYLGQGPGATGLIDADMGELGRFRTCFDYPDVKAQVERKLGRALSYGELNRWFSDQAWASMRADPARAMGLLVTKAGLLLSPSEIGHNKEVGVEVQHSSVLRILPVRFLVVLALCVWGVLAYGARRRVDRHLGLAFDPRLARLLWVQGLWVLGFGLSLLPYFAASRYRVPMLPHLLCLGAVGVVALWQRPGAKRLTLVLLAPAFLLALGLVQFDSRYAGPFPYKWHLDRGMTAAELGQLELAAQELAAAQSLAPNDNSIRAEIATLALRRKQYAEAQAGFEEVLRSDPTHPKALFNLGWLASQRRDYRAALEWYRKARASAPSLGVAQAAHGALIRQLSTDPSPEQRDGRVALQAMQAWIAGQTPTLGEWELLAACQAEVGQFDSALQSIDRALAAVPSQERTSVFARRLAAERSLYAKGEPLRIAPRP